MFIYFLVWCVFKVLSAIAIIAVLGEFVIAIPHRIILYIVVIVGAAIDMVISVENFRDKH